MRYLNRKERKFRLLAVEYEKRQRVVRGFLRCLPFRKNILYRVSYQLLSRWSFRRLKNRCKFTEQSRSVSRRYHVARSVFRGCASFGGFFGLRRCTW